MRNLSLVMTVSSHQIRVAYSAEEIAAERGGPHSIAGSNPKTPGTQAWR